MFFFISEQILNSWHHRKLQGRNRESHYRDPGEADYG